MARPPGIAAMSLPVSEYRNPSIAFGTLTNLM